MKKVLPDHDPKTLHDFRKASRDLPVKFRLFKVCPVPFDELPRLGKAGLRVVAKHLVNKPCKRIREGTLQNVAKQICPVHVFDGGKPQPSV